MKNIAKKLIVLSVAVIMLFAISLTASAENYGNITYEIINDEITITGYSGKLTTVTIPETIKGYPVTTIGVQAFSRCSTLKSITLPDTVKTISDMAFIDCTRLTSITIPTSVTHINADTFRGCTALASVTIPDSVIHIKDSAFYECKSLTDIKIPDSVKTIGDYAFEYCSSLTSIKIPDSVISLGVSAFSCCKKLETVVIGNGLKSVEKYAFNQCRALTDVKFGNSVKSIGQNAFEYCSALETIKLPDSLITIDTYAFRFCDGLKSLTIPDSVTTIGDSAFEDCKKLKTLTVGESVESVGKEAFMNSYSLSQINWNAKKANRFSAVFGYVGINTDGVNIVFGNSVESIPAYFIFYQHREPNIASVKFGNSVTYIGERAFYQCTGLKTVTLPCSVKTVAEDAFSNTILKKLVVYNPDCNIKKGEFPLPENTVIHAAANSSAIRYAKNNNHKYEILAPCKHTDCKWETVQKAETDANGKKQQYCTECGYIVAEQTIPALNSDYILGDANGDGKITAADARIVLRIAAQIDKIENYNLPTEALDVTADGKINAADARKILRISAKLE